MNIVDAVGRLDWVALVIGSVAYFLLGALWFTPLFGRAWDRSVGVTRSRGERFPLIYYVVPLLSGTLITIATVWLVAALELREPVGAVVLGAVVGGGIAAAVSITNAVVPTIPHPLVFGGITGGYHAIGITMVALIATMIG
ncbi:hypothetical protein ASF62_07845 [Leifsonia sp. Leaf325]|nr:DUF1761 domain-containing protein [Leifsonia sp. Leaf325]KQQ94062.1 hypothetical protein ASF62_07845 [Leifsonia sp. Leaf325]